MKREFLTYEQSIDMRAIGFNEPCLAYYDKDGDFLGDISVNEDTDNLYTNADFVMYQDFKVADVSAPTFSQAFRWFREKYELTSEVCVEQYRRKTNKKWMFSITYLNEDAMYEHSKTTFENYEEAELACLNKLIEIIENQKQK